MIPANGTSTIFLSVGGKRDYHDAAHDTLTLNNTTISMLSSMQATSSNLRS